MQFILSDRNEAEAQLLERLKKELESGKPILWLVSGGSNIGAEVEIMRQLPQNLTPQLVIMPIDERFGEPGHADANWQQMLDSGFNSKQARLLPVLRQKLNFEETRAYYEKIAASAFAQTKSRIALIGMGQDGHIAGILPHSKSAYEKEQLVAAYESPPLRRLTLTFSALANITAAYVFAFGGAKKSALENLRRYNAPVSEQPAQFLKQLPEAYVYNDQVGEID